MARVCGFDVMSEAVQVRQLIGADRAVRLGGRRADRQREPDHDRPAARPQPADAAQRRAAELLEQFGLADAGGRAAKTYSGGMRRRLDLAASLVGEPQVLFLDEPTTGLDPRARNQVWETIRGLSWRAGRPCC